MPASERDARLWLVTGGLGFIGHHLCRALLSRGDSVRVVDDYSDAPYPTVLKMRNEEELRREFPSFEVVRGCVTDRELAPRLLEGTYGVLHLAGLAGVRPSFADPARYARVNTEGTATLLDAAQRQGLELFVLASSSSVYGNATPLPAREEAPAIVPESPYAASKRSAELVASAMLRKTPSMRCPSLRFFTVYGPRQRPEMAITSFLRAILAGKPITVFGDGTMRRDFTHVEDIVRGVLAAAEKAPAGFRPYNLGSGAPVTLTELVEAMGKAASRTPTVVHAPVPLGDVDATFADISRAREELGWSPRLTLTEGLATVVRWLESERTST
ncbi:UDP-glucose 4-epimerase [Labilithrix luteola]|uniref:UDP-glucose 4-epimerase n=1 Tax=Labilithrix luteola TaxID=1391654 RepID=A0A0K1QAD6_9BACT|nr:NAD-dependent epimerase/dehydratase family protein [Labilithrix luteola]AKV02736.1 UDP-glucose 4-epimerase [Labilithrix luteola]